MIVKDKNKVYSNIVIKDDILSDSFFVNVIIENKVIFPNLEIMFKETMKSVIIRSHINIRMLFDILNDLSADEIREILTLLMLWLEDAIYCSKYIKR